MHTGMVDLKEIPLKLFFDSNFYLNLKVLRFTATIRKNTSGELYFLLNVVTFHDFEKTKEVRLSQDASQEKTLKQFINIKWPSNV